MTTPTTKARGFVQGTDPTHEPEIQGASSDDPLRILYLCGGSYVSGMEIIELAIMQGLKARGHDVHCVVSGWNDGDFISRLTEAGIPHTVAFTGKFSLSPRPKHLWWTIDALRHLPGARRTVRRQLDAFRPDVVVACNRDTVLGLRGVFRDYPVVYHLHEAPVVTSWNQRMMAALAKQCELVVTVSEFVGGRLVDLGVSSEKIQVVYNGLPITQRTGMGENGVFTAGICGQIGPWKGHEDLIEALGLLEARGVPFRCLVFGTGDPEFEERLQHRAVSLGIADRIEWRGFVRDQEALYRELDTAVVPSRVGDPLPTVALEAGARGIPVVVTQIGGLPEIVVDGETGYLVPVERPAELAARLETLATDSAKRSQMGAAGRERVRRKFAPERMVREHEEVLRRVAALW